MTTADIRKKYLDFFAKKGHAVLASASLIPENDPTTLFTGSGMQPVVPYLLGQPHPAGTRLADSQKCFRAQDMDEVGDNRHTTFFEMLGNWSLGDYFKREQIAWMFAFLTDDLGLDPSRLYVTVFGGNDALHIPRDVDSVLFWKEQFDRKGMEAQDKDFAEIKGMQGGRIFYYDETKNWWSRVGVSANMPAGEPGGPDTEMFWDFGAQLGLHEASACKDKPCHVNCDCGRYLEIGNNVFMQYKRTADGFEPLPKQNVDFGGGLERIAAALRNDPDVFNIDVFDAARLAAETSTGKTYGKDPRETRAFRVALDHLRAATFLIADGAAPSNKDQGYFSRRLIRRAVRFLNQLQPQARCRPICEAFIQTYATDYPDVAKKQKETLAAVDEEENKFRQTLQKGIKEFEKRFQAAGKVSGEDAFVLYASYGFPLELTREMASEKGQEVDTKTFDEEFRKHQELSRAGAQQKFAGGLADHSEAVVRLHTATHLLHQALRRVLGEHVYQRGSNITQERLRFDFSHPDKMTPDQIAKVEAQVNNAIARDLPVHFEMLSVAQAKERGAIGLFEDTYAQLGDKVKVYFVGDYSREVCGGPHVEHTGQLGHFSITKEEAVAAGIRRIKATVTGQKTA